MIRSILKLAVFLVIGILVYNFFFGTAEEKESSRQVFNSGKALVGNVVGLLKSEKDKFAAGKYDNALDKVDNLFDDLKEKAQDIDEKYVDRLRDLDDKREQLEEQLAEIKEDHIGEAEFTPKGGEKREVKNFERELDALMDQTAQLMEDMKTQ